MIDTVVHSTVKSTAGTGDQVLAKHSLERIVPLSEGHFRAALRAFVQHYHEERPHQGLGNELIAPTTTSSGTGPITCRARLGGVLKFYDREAA